MLRIKRKLHLAVLAELHSLNFNFYMSFMEKNKLSIFRINCERKRKLNKRELTFLDDSSSYVLRPKPK